MNDHSVTPKLEAIIAEPIRDLAVSIVNHALPSITISHCVNQTVQVLRAALTADPSLITELGARELCRVCGLPRESEHCMAGHGPHSNGIAFDPVYAWPVVVSGSRKQ